MSLVSPRTADVNLLPTRIIICRVGPADIVAGMELPLPIDCHSPAAEAFHYKLWRGGGCLRAHTRAREDQKSNRKEAAGCQGCGKHSASISRRSAWRQGKMVSE